MEDKLNTNQDLIEIEINYAKSFLYQNEKGLWLVLNVVAVNLTDEPQKTKYTITFGKPCSCIKRVAPKVQKGKHIYPLSPKTVTATVTDELFTMAPHEERNDTLVVSDLDGTAKWRVEIGDKEVDIDKIQLKGRTKLE